MLIVIGLLFGVLWAWLATRMAKSRGRNPITWGIISFVFGLFGIAALAIAGKTGEQKALELQSTATATPQADASEVHVPDTVPESWTQEVERLGKLHDSGALSDEEFEAKKEKVLAHH
ncbi:MAG: SHOCT domain-containing protein [Gaiellaceae bacterium]